MELTLKVGDRVRCVDAGFAYGGRLESGAVYVVSMVFRVNGESFVRLAVPGDPGWYAKRFVLASGQREVAPENRSRVDAGPNWGVR